MYAATCHDMHFIRIVESSRPAITEAFQAEFQLMQHAYARQDPAIRYRGFELALARSAPPPPPPTRPRGLVISAPQTVPDADLAASARLLPLDVARRCRHITHRREGFEMLEARKRCDSEAVRNGWF